VIESTHGEDTRRLEILAIELAEIPE
jgi:hypothetical protein